jgi:hypothetical protein
VMKLTLLPKKEGSQLAGFIMAVSEDPSKTLLFPFYQRIPLCYSDP